MVSHCKGGGKGGTSDREREGGKGLIREGDSS